MNQKWCGLGMISNATRPGRTVYVLNEELTAKVRKRIQEDRCLIVRMTADESDVIREIIRKILVEYLG